MGLGVLPTPIALLFAIHLFSFFLSQPCTATDTVDSAHPIKDGRTLVSAKETFELGFFSVGNSQLRYVGIWYKKIPLRKYVWVANRENPLSDSSGTLTIGSGGNLVILDGNQDVVWRTNVSAIWNSSTAVLLDTGNLQLTEGGNANGGGKVLWESFQQPSNTFLQNMQIVKNTKTGESRFITSWKSDDDPAPGNFSFGLNPRDLRQVFIWNGTKPHWRSGHWNGRSFIGVPRMEDESVYLNGVSLFTDTVEGTVYFQFALYDPSMVMFFELSSSGMLQKLDWDGDKQRWATEWRGPQPNGCDAYNFCGPFARCKESKSPVCGCLKGFVPRDADGWRRGDHSGGCVRRTELGCEKKDGGEEQDRFWKIEKIKLPDFAIWVAGLNASECAVKCLNNCTCVAHAHVGGIGCFHWGGKMVDIEEFSNGGEDLHIRLARSEFEKSRKMHVFVAVMVVLFGLLIIIVTGSCILVISRSKRKGRKISRFFNSAANNAFKHLANGNLFRESVIKEGAELPLFSLDGIEIATNYFSEANKIGAGGFGPVYKGKLRGGQEIAVKRLSKSSGQGMEEFKNEAIFISRLQHRNLVRLLGCCIEGEEKMLIYEYMPNKSLDSFLFDANRRAQLDWSKRFHIVEGIARGLLYLHRDSRLRIIHRDLKASNILLDEEMNPKISDFGMAWSFGGSQTLTETNKVVGTYGYMAPEYEKEGQFSEKSDVFSFGVLLLEIVSGKKNSSFYHDELSLNLLGYAWLLWNENRLTDLVDPALGDSYSMSEVSRCIHVGLLCVQEMASDRPKISTVVFMLGSEIAIRPSPAAPAASVDRDSSDSAKPFLKDAYSVNNLSITTMDGR